MWHETCVAATRAHQQEAWLSVQPVAAEMTSCIYDTSMQPSKPVTYLQHIFDSLIAILCQQHVALLLVHSVVSVLQQATQQARATRGWTWANCPCSTTHLYDATTLGECWGLCAPCAVGTGINVCSTRPSTTVHKGGILACETTAGT